MLTPFTFSNLRLFREPQSIKSDRREDFVHYILDVKTMTNELTLNKITNLIEHWIEHNNSHIESFNSWAGKIEQADFAQSAKNITLAAQKMNESNEHLKRALKELYIDD